MRERAEMGTKETALSLHLQYPKDYIAFTRGFSSSHKGVDMGWNSQQGGPHVPVYAPADGTVVSAGYDSSYGYYVMIEHAKGVRTLMAHMAKDSLTVKVGYTVKRKQTVGIQGSTGNSTGYHVHFELRLDGVKVDPVPYVFAYPDQVVNAYTEKEYGIKHYSPTVFVGTPVERNPKVDQIKVLTNTLRAREEPNLNGKIDGYIRTGIYDVHGITDADGYRWYSVDDWWIANNKEETWCNYLPKTEVKYTVSLLHVTEDQRDDIADWCQQNKIEYVVHEE